VILEKQEVFQDQSKHQRKVKQKRFLLKMMIQIKEMLRKRKIKTRKISTMIRKDLEFFLIVKNHLTETIKAMKEKRENKRKKKKNSFKNSVITKSVGLMVLETVSLE
jgi:uncharacterized membrane protein YidH (DUF202 family)